MNQEIKAFLNCELDEAEYYSLPKENLITLKDYLLQLKEKDSYFTSATQELFQSIKQKCNWLTSIKFNGLVTKDGIYEITAIYLYSKDGIDLIANYNKKNNRYEDLTKDIPKIYLLSKKVRNHLQRQKDIELIQQELYELDNIGRNVYKDILIPISSVSKNFEIYYTPQSEMGVYNEYDLIANYYLNC